MDSKKEMLELHAGLAAIEQILIEKGIVTVEELNKAIKACRSEGEQSSGLEIN